MKVLAAGYYGADAVAYASGGQTLLALSLPRRLRFWDTTTFSERLSVSPAKSVGRKYELHGLTVLGDVVGFADTLVDASRALAWLRHGTGEPPVDFYPPVIALEGLRDRQAVLGATPGGNLLVGVTSWGVGQPWRVLFWDLRGSLQHHGTFPRLEQPPVLVASNGREVALLNWTDSPALCDPFACRILARLKHHVRAEQAVFTPDGKLLATAAGKSVWLWDVATHEVVTRFPPFRAPSRRLPSIPMAPSSRRAAVAERSASGTLPPARRGPRWTGRSARCAGWRSHRTG
jgi:hypothetical protein